MSSRQVSRSYVTTTRKTVPVGEKTIVYNKPILDSTGTTTIISRSQPRSKTIIQKKERPHVYRHVKRTIPLGGATSYHTTYSSGPTVMYDSEPMYNRYSSEMTSMPVSRSYHTTTTTNHNDLLRRQNDWEDEIDRFRKDFYRETPFEESVKQEPKLKLFPDASTSEVTTTERRIVNRSRPKKKPFSVDFPLQGFEPEDISVRVLGSTLTVTAEKDNPGGGGIQRSFSKSVGLPSDVDGDLLVSTFDDDTGVLTVALPESSEYDHAYSDGTSSASDLHDDSSTSDLTEAIEALNIPKK